MLRAMERLKPIVDLAVVNADEEAELLQELESSAADEAAGELVDFDAVIARLGSKEERAELEASIEEGFADVARGDYMEARAFVAQLRAKNP